MTKPSRCWAARNYVCRRVSRSWNHGTKNMQTDHYCARLLLTLSAIGNFWKPLMNFVKQSGSRWGPTKRRTSSGVQTVWHSKRRRKRCEEFGNLNVPNRKFQMRHYPKISVVNIWRFRGCSWLFILRVRIRSMITKTYNCFYRTTMTYMYIDFLTNILLSM